MKTLTRFTLATLAAAYLFACSGPTKPDYQSFVYPLAVGNQWVYDYTEISVYSDTTPTDTIQYRLTATVVKADTILPGIVGYVMQESGEDPFGYEFEGLEAFINLPDGMYAYYHSAAVPTIILPSPSASDGASAPDPRRVPGSTLPFVLPYSAGTSSGIEYFDPAPLVFPYPQKTGYRWLVGDTAIGFDNLYWLDKQIAGWETVTAPAGTFDGVSIEWIFHGFIDPSERVDVIAPVGLVLRTVDSYDIPVTDYSFPYGSDVTMDVHMRYELVSYTLK